MITSRRNFLKLSTALCVTAALEKPQDAFAAFLGPGTERLQNWITVGDGQLTPYNTPLMDLQLLYRFGLNYELYTDKNHLNRILQAQRIEEIKDLAVKPALFERMQTRLKNPLELLQQTLGPNQTKRPYFIAPDILDINNAAGTNISPEEFIGREVFLSSTGKYSEEGEWLEEPVHTRTIIMDVLNPEHRSANRNFFSDAGINIFEEHGITYRPQGGPYFTTLNGIAVYSLPFIEMQIDMEQFNH